MRNEFVYFAKSIPRWITVDAPDSRCIKAATDKFPPGGAQKTAFSRRRGWIWSLVAPRSISLGRHGSRCWIPIVPIEAACTHACPACTRRRAERASNDELISSHWPTLTRLPYGTMRGDCTLLFIFTRRGINLRLSRIQPAYAESMAAHTFAHSRLRTRTRAYGSSRITRGLH